ncbi:hypothetical protein BDZ91DRAFT_157357 [Kalaharituber pfeilii]|nr:hypothetical protein BDZ91DRAFT_157357 [Kalaharituber pfeilii]
MIALILLFLVMKLFYSRSLFLFLPPVSVYSTRFCFSHPFLFPPSVSVSSICFCLDLGKESLEEGDVLLMVNANVMNVTLKYSLRSKQPDYHPRRSWDYEIPLNDPNAEAPKRPIIQDYPER